MLRSIAKLRSVLLSRVILAAIVLALLGFFSFGGTEYLNSSPTTVCAGPCYIIERYYYDDATYTNLVGYKITGCTGGSNQWGIVPTPYEQIEYGGCCPWCCD